MFAHLSRRYDLINSILSFGLDSRWRDKAARLVTTSSNGIILDAATGTGKLALKLPPEIPVIALDFCPEMLQIAKEKADKLHRSNISFVAGDILQLPFNNNSFGGIVIGFGLRNLDDISAGLAEFHRTLKPGGILVCLEFTTVNSWLASTVYHFYLQKVVPFIGKLVSGHRDAYLYLGDSIRKFPPRDELKKLMEEAGFKQVKFDLLNLKAVAIHSGIK